MKEVRVRIAPSPTGEDLHIGNAYTALINFIIAKKNKGQFIIRIEDTDRKRLVLGSEKRILNSLKWLGLTYDEGPDVGGPYGLYRQSERLDLYRYYAEKLVKKGCAYYCYCSPERLKKLRQEQDRKDKPPMYDRKCRTRSSSSEVGSDSSEVERRNTTPYVIRLKVPKSGETSFDDIIRGKITFKNELIDDQVLLKSDGFPTYHLAVVVDDKAMKISHIIRAEEWISSVPKHILLYKAFGWKIPYFAHLPLLRNPDRSKLSKRKNPVWVSWYQKQGFLPEAILNYLALMAWSMPDGREIFSLDEYIKEFSLKKVATSAPVFDLEKLEWMNGEYIRKLKIKNLKLKILGFFGEKYPAGLVEKILPLIQTRIKKLTEFEDMAGFFFKRPKVYEKKINTGWLRKAIKVLEKENKWQHKNLYLQMGKLAQTLAVSKSKLFMEIRIAVTGKKIGPPLFESMEVLGKKETIERVKLALKSF